MKNREMTLYPGTRASSKAVSGDIEGVAVAGPGIV